MIPVFKNVRERSTAKNYRPVSLLPVVSKVFGKLVNNRIVDHVEKCGRLSDFRYGFRSSRSTADLVTVASERIARALIRSGATRAVELDISKAFDRVWHAVLHKLKCYGISSQIFGLISCCLCNRWLRVVLDGKSSREYPVNTGVPQGSILGTTLFLLYINDLPDMLSVILLSLLMILLSILSVIRHLICGNKYDPRYTVDWGKKLPVDVNT